MWVERLQEGVRDCVLFRAHRCTLCLCLLVLMITWHASVWFSPRQGHVGSLVYFALLCNRLNQFCALLMTLVKGGCLHPLCYPEQWGFVRRLSLHACGFAGLQFCFQVCL